jgi:antitoxin HigA-1
MPKLPIIIERDNNMEKKLKPLHPGEVLLEEFLKSMGISQNHLAIKIGVPDRRINEIVLGKRRITADTALRLAQFFGTTAKFWQGLQTDYDLDVTADESGERIEREVSAYNPAG